MRLIYWIVLVSSLTVHGHALAQTFPTRAVHLIVTFSAGGPSDVLARAMAPELSKSLGVPVIVENRVGAGGTLAMGYVAKSPPDGYVIGLGLTATQSIAPYVYKTLAYVPLKDFAPVTPLVSYADILVCTPKLPAKNLGELLAYARANPNAVTMGSGGNGSSTHMSIEVLKKLTGTEITHVPYNGTKAAMSDLLAGHISCIVDVLSTSIGFVNSGTLNAIGVTSAKRSQFAPNVPTLDEAGVPSYSSQINDLWYGAFVPAGTPPAIIDKLNAALTKVMDMPEVKQRVVAASFDRWTSSPDDFAKFLKVDDAKWRTVVNNSGAKIE